MQDVVGLTIGAVEYYQVGSTSSCQAARVNKKNPWTLANPI